MNGKKEEYIDSDISPDSVQLSAGQKFHHTGSNGVTYFKLNVVLMADGSLYPMTTTARACNVLPVECDHSGKIIAVYFLAQKGRDEMKDDATALKAVGSFCNVNESSHEGAIRSLEGKLGMNCLKKDLIFVGCSYGFGNQFCFPIDLFITKNYMLRDQVPSFGCERIRMTLEDIARAQKERLFFNSETIDMIATILLRNNCRDIYDW
jgi:hypothetical protein